MATKQPDRVVVVKAFQNGLIGNKEVDDEFDYDLRADPHQLKVLGLVKKVPAKEETKG